MNENQNVYFQARKKAAAYNERLWSREGAAELLGISVSTLADYELGNTKVVPVDKVVLMADLYKTPELITGYCMRECPVHGFLPLATEEKSLEALVYGGRQYSLHIGQQIQTDYRDQLPDSDSRQIRREVGDMVIVGYYAHGNKHYVAFKDEADTKGRFMITDGFHDRPVTERNQGKYEGYVKIDKAECNIKKIIGRIRGTRPWHPLLRLLQKEAG